MSPLLLLVLAAAPAPHLSRHSVPAAPKVEVENVAGAVRVRAGASGQVEVRAEAQAGETRPFEVAVAQEEGRLEVQVCCGPCRPRPTPCGKAPRVELDVTVPPDTRLEVQTVSAPVEVEGVEGAQQLTSVEGALSSRGARAPLSVDTVSGKVALAPAAAVAVRAETVNGDVRVQLPRGTGAEVQLEAVNGRLNGRPVRLGEARETVGQGGPRLQVETVSGTLTVQEAP